ncbi:MBL fold metallo-hydrolase, partial [bacterium]|nr:MBL fold metallo-hydrolase [bacterium]
MEVLLLGCGSSVGSPVIGRELDSFDSKNFRTRSSVLITENNKNILIDTGADFRYQALRYKIKKIDIVLYTHSHADHTHGIDDLRIFSYIKKDKINCFANNYTIRDIKKNFSYIFDPVSTSGRPRLKMKEVKDTFVEQGINIIPVEIKHKDWDILGYRINNFAYITDCSSIPDKSMEKLGGLDLLILDSLRFSPHESHLSVDQAIEIVDKLKPKKTILTHLSS